MKFIFKKSSSTENLEKYRDLYLRCFQNDKFKIDYLNWLYNKNPDGNYLGIDCFDDKNLIGQVGGIPHEFFYNHEKLKILISINVCVDKNYRGKNLFSEMAKKFEMLARESNFDGIIAIGNKFATPAWIKSISLINCGKLDAFIGLGEINENNISLNKNNYKFYSHWDHQKINWRIKNPENKTFIVKNDKKINSVYALTKFPFIKAYTPLIFFNKEIQQIKNKNYILQPFIFLGKIFKLKNKTIINVPELLKPSPLNFLYKFFKIKNNLKKNEIFFSFLDFDIF